MSGSVPIALNRIVFQGTQPEIYPGAWIFQGYSARQLCDTQVY